MECICNCNGLINFAFLKFIWKKEEKGEGGCPVSMSFLIVMVFYFLTCRLDIPRLLNLAFYVI